MHIYRYENPSELETLHRPCVAVGDDEEVSLDALNAMFALMHQHNGIGLAAPQVGISQRFFIIEIDKGTPYVFINPEIVETSPQMVTSEEGCLSLPGLYAEVPRYREITVQAEGRDRKRFQLKATGLMAMCIQHEYDHLNGVLHVDKVADSVLKNQLLERYLRKQKSAHRRGR